MRRAGVVLLTVGAMAAAPAAVLAAIPIPIRPPPVVPKPPPHVTIPSATPQEIRAATESLSTYGTGVQHVETRLETYTDNAASTLQEDISRLGKTPQVRDRLRQCTATGLKSAAETYGEAMASKALELETEVPSVHESFQTSAYACISEQIDVPAETLEATGTYLSREIHTYFEDVSAETRSGPAQQRWLQVTAAEIAATPGPDPGPVDGDGDGDGSSPLPWILGGAVLLLGAVLAVWRPWQTS